MASETNEIASLHSVVRDAGNWLKAANVPGVVIGGVAAALLGRPRVTKDVDLLVWIDEDRLQEFMSACLPWGFVPRISDAVEFS